jgi:hypothetical protein
MQGANKERWKVLCEQAAVEQDPKKLLELTRQINELLLGKQRRLSGEASPDKPDSPKQD